MTIAEAGAITFSTHAVRLLRATPAIRRSSRVRRRCAPTSSGPTPTSTGTRPSTRSRRSRDASRGTRTTATRSSSRSSTSRAGSRSPTPTEDNGCPWVAPGLHRYGTLRTPTSTRSATSASTSPPAAVAAPVAGGRASSCSRRSRRTCTGPNTHRRGAQGVHRAVRAPGRADVPGDPTRARPPARCRPTRPSASSRCCAPACRSDPVRPTTALRPSAFLSCLAAPTTAAHDKNERSGQPARSRSAPSTPRWNVG